MTEYSRKKLVHGCTQPKLHPKPKPTKTKAELKAEAELAALKDELTKSAGAAAEARATFLRDQLAKVSDPAVVRTRLQALVVDAFQFDVSWARDLKGARVMLDILGAPVPEVVKGTDEEQQTDDLAEALGEALVGLNVNALVLALDIATHIAGETSLRKVDPYPGLHTYGAPGRAWTATLTAYGYPWSDWERDRFTGTEYSQSGSARWNVDGPVADEPADGPADDELGGPDETA
ncbi:hypothetical protein G7075_00110 [Phycicoccus sp. HDW14]|uniref:hypothetical protein n=1 Tax=Phycicoccus sp. HDW14 TaxID=2714941 RepID=UPI001407E674|nr:hypothetical protein [Phycicoccus sp. HDW14]QIM19899.1 hypothetical protein G7075_00110 [Phycicoccus sp. HDW14]